MLAVIEEAEVALAEGAAGEHLEAVDAAGVVLDDRDDLLVAGGVGAERLEADARGAVPEREPGAAVPVERDRVLEGVCIHHGLIKDGETKKRCGPRARLSPRGAGV